MWPTWSYKNNIMFLLDRTLQGSFAQREWKVFDGKANIFIHFERQSQISWLSKLCKLNVREGLQEKLWIRASSRVLMNKPALPIPSSSAHPSLMISALSTLLPVSYTRARTHTHAPAQGVAKEMITSLWTSVIYAERVPVKQEEKTMILKINKRISAYRERYGRTVAEKMQQEKKKKQQEPRIRHYECSIFAFSSSGNLTLTTKLFLIFLGHRISSSKTSN